MLLCIQQYGCQLLTICGSCVPLFPRSDHRRHDSKVDFLFWMIAVHFNKLPGFDQTDEEEMVQYSSSMAVAGWMVTSRSVW
jgi:hypothetical protein